MNLHLKIILIFYCAFSLSCKENSFEKSDFKIEQSARDGETITDLPIGVKFRFVWDWLDLVGVNDSPGVPEVSLTFSICADHNGADDCRFIDFESGYYSTSYKYMTPVFKKKHFKNNHAVVFKGWHVDQAARGKASFNSRPLRPLPKRIKNKNKKYGEYYINIKMWEEDLFSNDDFLGSDCKYLEDIHTGGTFVIRGSHGKVGEVSIAAAVHTDRLAEQNKPLVFDETTREGCDE